MAQVQRKNVTHKWHAMIDWMIANPSGTNRELAEYMGMGEPSVSIIKHSDGFKALMQHKLDEKTRELRRIMNDKLLSVGGAALDIVSERLVEKRHVLPIKDAMEIAKPVLDALGFGARGPLGGTQVNVNTGPQVSVNHISLEELRSAQAEMRMIEAQNAEHGGAPNSAPEGTSPRRYDPQVIEHIPEISQAQAQSRKDAEEAERRRRKSALERIDRRNEQRERREFWSTFPEK